jgi:hypothetical protein
VSTTPSDAPVTAAATPLARFEAFAIVFGLAYTIIYTLCDQMSWTLFTYHPAMHRLGFGFELPRSGEGPAIYWYGWIATAFVISFVLGLAATMLPGGAVRKIPFALLWVVPIFALFTLAWSLSLFYLR